MVARRAHNPKVVGSNPAPATTFKKTEVVRYFGFFIPSGYEPDSSWLSLYLVRSRPAKVAGSNPAPATTFRKPK